MEADPWLGDGPDRFAPADSLLGMLQRGRGAGYLRALRAPPEVVRPLLVRCLTQGPFHQFDPRGDYFAHLILHTGMELEPVAASLRERDNDKPDSPVRLAIDTLVTAAGLGNEEALRILRDYAGWGHEWGRVLVDLSIQGRQDLFSSWSDRVLCRCAAGVPDDLAIHLALSGESDIEPWRSWRRQCPAIDRSLLKWRVYLPTGSHEDPPRLDPELERLSFEELFELLASEPASGECPQLSPHDLNPETHREPRRAQASRLLLDRIRNTDRELLHSALTGSDNQRCLLALECLWHLRDPQSLTVLRTFFESNPEMPAPLRSGVLTPCA